MIQHYVIKVSQWFSLVSSTNKSDRHDITEINVESGDKHHNPNPKTSYPPTTSNTVVNLNRKPIMCNSTYNTTNCLIITESYDVKDMICALV